MRTQFVAMTLALALVGIGAAGPGCSTLDRGGLTQTLVDEKALYTTEAAYFGAASAVEAGLDQGLIIKDSPAAKDIAAVEFKAYTALRAARAAYAVGNKTNTAAQISAAQGFIATVWGLIPGQVKE